MSEIARALKAIKERFGIDEKVFDGFSLIEKGDIWISSKEATTIKVPGISRVGIRLIRVFRDGYKLTTAGIQLFGKYATKNVLEISEDKLQDYLEGKDIYVGPSECEEGQVIVKCGKDYLGSGLYAKGKLKNQLPKGRRWF
ncbi:MAG: methyltransferase RsmF C-terminal domain-like protein [Candidatus Hydrothermia bacterium]